jgi:hypothetical protein
MLPFAALIGELCIEWTHLEGWIERLFMSVGEWPYTGRATMNMTRLIKQRDMIAAIKVGIASRAFSTPVCEVVIESMEFTDNYLRPARNRCVHDVWAISENLTDAVRLELTPKIQKVRGANEFLVKSGTITQVSTIEMREIISDVSAESDHIQKLLPFTAWNPALAHSRLTQLPAPPQRLLLLRQREMQRQKDKALAAQTRQRKSSQA